MGNLTKIEPEPPVDLFFTDEYMKRLSNEGHILNMTSATDIIRILIHKVNELTEEVNKLKEKQNASS